MLPGSAGEYWRGRRVFLTGATGFKGAWLSLWLHRLGAVVAGYALPPEPGDSLYTAARVGEIVPTTFADLRNFERLEGSIKSFAPQVVLHLAAQPLVRQGYAQPLETFSTNVQGTCHVLEAARRLQGLESVLVVTTDKCYLNRGWDWGYREDDTLGGSDPYSASKAAAELAVAAWRASWLDAQGVAVATARGGNVVGGGDWAADRLVPDLVRAHRADSDLVIRYPDATRPWQHVLDCLGGYLLLAQSLPARRQHARGWNFGPAPEAEMSVRRVIESFGELLPARVRFDTQPQVHEAARLVLDSSQARKHLGWQPRLGFHDTMGWTASWYRRFLRGEDARELTLEQIAAWERIEGAAA